MLTLTPRDPGASKPFWRHLYAGDHFQPNRSDRDSTDTILCPSDHKPHAGGTTLGYFGADPFPFKVGSLTFANGTNGWPIVGDFSAIAQPEPAINCSIKVRDSRYGQRHKRFGFRRRLADAVEIVFGAIRRPFYPELVRASELRDQS